MSDIKTFNCVQFLTNATGLELLPTYLPTYHPDLNTHIEALMLFTDKCINDEDKAKRSK